MDGLGAGDGGLRVNFFKAEDENGPRTVAFADWGPPDADRTVVCVHGLTRNGRDFDALAGALADAGMRVICPDVAGRGLSDWLADESQYGVEFYARDMLALLAHVQADRVDWVGTSMGGLIGMALAAAGVPIRRLVLNDVGPFLPKASLERIAAYVGGNPVFAEIGGLEAYLRQVHAPFGDLSDAQWRHLAEHSARTLPDGQLALHYDPGIAAAFRGKLEDIDLWEAVWDNIACPTMVLRGESSDLLLPEVAAEMAARGPKAAVVEIAGCGHAPALMDAAQIEVVSDWLTAP